MLKAYSHDGQEPFYLPDINIARTLTPEYAKRLADLHLALAQLYREIAGLEPVSTAANQRKLARKGNR